MTDRQRYCLPRRRARHRDKLALYAVLLAIYVGIQLVTGASTTKPLATTPDTADTVKPALLHHSSSILSKANEHADKVGSTSSSTANMKPTILQHSTQILSKARDHLDKEESTSSDAADSSKTLLHHSSNVISKARDHVDKVSEDPTAIPTWRPRRENCSPPAIEQFPNPLIGPSARKHGGLIIHVALAVYAFIGLAIVCDDYFVSSLDRICEEMKLSPDVAGATFMAAGSSAPELATVVIGVFIAQDDIGVSGVIGSAVFNIMFVISVCALCSTTVCYLNWWPLCRDCFFYTLSILLMLFSIYNEKISWPESLMMLIMYVIYCVTLYFNPRLEQWAQTLPVPCRKLPDQQEGPVTYKTLDEGPSQDGYLESPDKVNFGSSDVSNNGASAPTGFPQGPPNQAFYKPKDPDPNETSPLIKPTDGGRWTLLSWYLALPIHYMCRLTIPDCKSDRYRNWYILTFFISMTWISFYSYFMVWMITVVGSTLGIPDTVMGLTFVAAGVSVPDALSSLAVVKEGYGDMAVSNAVGSNVFDILVCLGLPWFIQTAIIQPGSHVNVLSRGLVYSTLSLLSTVVFLLVATHLNGWKLDRKYGIMLMMWYLFFIVFASLYELNVFGYMTPPECPSLY